MDELQPVSNRSEISRRRLLTTLTEIALISGKENAQSCLALYHKLRHPSPTTLCDVSQESHSSKFN